MMYGYGDPAGAALVASMIPLFGYRHLSFWLANHVPLIPRHISERTIDRIAFAIGCGVAIAGTVLFIFLRPHGWWFPPVALVAMGLVKMMVGILSRRFFGEPFDDV